MALWNRSDDPWDQRPKERAGEKKRIENPLDTVKRWNERRRAAAAEKAEAEAALPPERCPWCGGDAERGYLAGGRGVFWNSGKPSAASAWLGPGIFEGSVQIDGEGGLLTGGYKTAWYCRKCRRMFFSVEERVSSSSEEGSGENRAGRARERYAEERDGGGAG